MCPQSWAEALTLYHLTVGKARYRRGRATGPLRPRGDIDARHYQTRWEWWAHDLGRARAGADIRHYRF
jgi:hypothetical protein